MVRIELVSRDLNDDRTTYRDVVRVEFTVQGSELEVLSGDASWLDLDIPVLDCETGRTLRFEDDPEGWARALPAAFRSGDIVAIVQDVAVAVSIGT